MRLSPAPSPSPFEKEILDTVTHEFNETVPAPINHHLDKNLQKHHAVMMAGPLARIKTTAHA